MRCIRANKLLNPASILGGKNSNEQNTYCGFNARIWSTTVSMVVVGSCRMVAGGCTWWDRKLHQRCRSKKGLAGQAIVYCIYFLAVCGDVGVFYVVFWCLAVTLFGNRAVLRGREDSSRRLVHLCWLRCSYMAFVLFLCFFLFCSPSFFLLLVLFRCCSGAHHSYLSEPSISAKTRLVAGESRLNSTVLIATGVARHHLHHLLEKRQKTPQKIY